MTRNLRLTIEYDGTEYQGWQRQPAPARTIQEQIEDAIETMTGSWSCLRGAGRTDAGVHARAQVANFRTDAKIPPMGFLRGLNALLPRDIAITAIDEVEDDFDARRSARGKHYAYRLWNREPRSPLHHRFSWHIHAPLDLDAMRSAARHLLGEHDFTAFRASDCDRKNPVRTIHRLDLVEESPHLLALHIEATAFLKHMIRVIAGTLVEVGLHSRPPESLPATLASLDRSQSGRTAPPHGLTLERVVYGVTLPVHQPLKIEPL